MSDEIFPLVNEAGELIGKATRNECHARTFLLHPVVHLHVFNSAGELYLQKRSADKDIQPDKWDTSVGGHVDYGETIEDALFREVREELGITDFVPVFIDKYKFRSNVEAELVYSYYAIYDGVISPNENEITEGKFWSIAEIKAVMEQGVFTPNFENEFQRLIEPLWTVFSPDKF